MKNTHGGKRKGAGRKQSAPTVVYQLKIPVALNDKLMAIPVKYRNEAIRKFMNVLVDNKNSIKTNKRHLDDILIEIDVDGYKFCPIIELAKIFHDNEGFNITHFTLARDFGSHYKVRCHIDSDYSRAVFFGMSRTLSEIEPRIKKILKTWGFDVDVNPDVIINKL